MKSDKERPAVFLDRDGVIIVEKDFQIDPDGIEFLNGSIMALRGLVRSYLTVVITNQSGVARGFFGAEDVVKFNKAMDKQLRENGIEIAGWYFCPHGPEEDCPCRKPKPGLIFRAAEELNIDLAKSWMIGDKSSDIGAGLAAGMKTILVKTGYGGHEPGAGPLSPGYIARDLRHAMEIIIKGGRSK